MYLRVLVIAAALSLLASSVHAGVNLVQSSTAEFSHAYSGQTVEASFSPGFRTDGVLDYQ